MDYYWMNSPINPKHNLCSLLFIFLTLFLLTLLLTNYTQIPSYTTPFDFIRSDNTSAAAPGPAIQHSSIQSYLAKAPVSTPAAGKRHRRRKCRMYEGEWVYKPEENPMYQLKQCPFLEEKMSCQKNGRSDLLYQSWGWHSHDCRIPLFDGKKMMEKLRGKRMIMVGDSLNRNMWESLACLLYTCISDPTRALVQVNGTYNLFTAKDYNFSLEFYWAPFLVHLNDTGNSTVVALDRLEPSSVHWQGADVMVFNTGHWWTRDGDTKTWDFFEYEGKLVEDMEREVAYERALTKWAAWIHQNVDPTKTKVFFRSFSPEHLPKDWCRNATRPITNEPDPQLLPWPLIKITENKIRGMEGQVSYLNITMLSWYRVDAHPSIYRFSNWNRMETHELMRRSDCKHWCLPGLPDTWNRILYASLFFHNLSPGDFIDSSS